MFERILASIKEKLNNTKILDRYILKQVIEMFLMGVFVFTTIIFASDTFITLIKQIAKFGIPFKVAFIMILLIIMTFESTMEYFYVFYIVCIFAYLPVIFHDRGDWK